MVRLMKFQAKGDHAITLINLDHIGEIQWRLQPDGPSERGEVAFGYKDGSERCFWCELEQFDRLLVFLVKQGVVAEV